MTAPHSPLHPKGEAYLFTFSRVIPAIIAFALAAGLGAFSGRTLGWLIRAPQKVTSPQLLCFPLFVMTAFLVVLIWRLPPSQEKTPLSLRLCTVSAAICLVAGLAIGGIVSLASV